MNLTIENKRGERFEISNSTDYTITQITGLTPPVANINLSTMGLIDGSLFNSSRLSERNITITIVPTNSVERSRVNLYRYIKTKHYIKLYFKTNTRNVFIEGYVESMEGDLYENPQKLMISIICPDPYFKDIENVMVDFSTVTSIFEFENEPTAEGAPVSEYNAFQEINLFNPSDDDTGVIFDLYASGNVVEPTIYNQTTNEMFRLNVEMLDGDHIVIDTWRGKKSVKRDGDNLMDKVDVNTKWLKILSGDNILSYVCAYGAENLKVVATVQPIYEGV